MIHKIKEGGERYGVGICTVYIPRRIFPSFVYFIPNSVISLGNNEHGKCMIKVKIKSAVLLWGDSEADELWDNIT